MVCESCNERIAMVTVEFNDGERFRVCTGCLAEDDSKRDPKYRVVRVFTHPSGWGPMVAHPAGSGLRDVH